MGDFNIRSDAVDVEQIMEQIRARIREKRGVDYTEQQIRELAAVKLEKFLDPRGIRSDLLDEFRRLQPAYEPPEPPNYRFEDTTLFESHRGAVEWIRRLLRPILKLFFNPNPLIQALNIQSRLNTLYAERHSTRRALDHLYFEVMHNLVLETTRLGIEVKNLKMQVESVTSRLEFNERRARALESVVVYRPADEGPPDRGARLPSDSGTDVRGRPDVLSDTGGSPAAAGPSGVSEGPGQRSRRRRRRRGRRSGAGAVAAMPGTPPGGQPPPASSDEAAADVTAEHGGAAETVERALASNSESKEPPNPTGSDPDQQ